MNWLDIVLIVALAIPTFLGLRQGLIKAVLSLVGLIVGVILAGNFYQTLGQMLGFFPNPDIANIVAFAIILVAVFVIASILSRLLRFLVSLVLLGWVDRLSGAILGLLIGTIFWGALLATWVKFFGTGLVTESLIAGVLLDKFPLVLALLPSEFDAIRSFFQSPGT
jgi:membrane protein required for colicin V production